ncbi:uncharacterized protein N7511_002206 [Penicillium nucicola]|uniref:uncharacterized protein n=1 Tax=Penicillium nucicola TaxID=1850975 RepID=UPI002544FCCA|nr:uncharacterized protein N7511_002206 [Penicillium nucicola]KAJ5770155.1 hypothetical protein N7511_002206 [Penicillium nucicola]
MQFSHALIALVAATLANAQLPDVPACSLSCFVTALTTDGCSELTDFACHCQKTSLVSTITPCVQKACEVKDQISVSNAVVSQCSSAGHPIVVPPIETTSASSSAAETSASSSSSSSAPAETSASASASASASESSSAAGSSSAAESSSAASSSAAGSATATATASSGAGASSSGAAASTPLATKTGSASASASSPAYTGAAANVKGNMAGVAMIAAAAAYVL